MSSSEHPPEADPAGHPPSADSARLWGRLAAVGALILAVGFLSGLLLLIADDPLGFPLAFVSVFRLRKGACSTSCGAKSPEGAHRA